MELNLKMNFFKTFCNENGISHNFSSPRTPKKNGAVERKNRTLVEMSRTMLNEYSLPLYFWPESALHVIFQIEFSKDQF